MRGAVPHRLLGALILFLEYRRWHLIEIAVSAERHRADVLESAPRAPTLCMRVVALPFKPGDLARQATDEVHPLP